MYLDRFHNYCGLVRIGYVQHSLMECLRQCVVLFSIDCENHLVSGSALSSHLAYAQSGLE